MGLKSNVTLLLFPYEEEGRRGRLGKPFFSQEGQKVAEGNGLNNHVVSGWGIRFSNTSTAFVGQFVKNQLSGQGIQFVDQQIVYEGQFKDDIRSGTPMSKENWLEQKLIWKKAFKKSLSGTSQQYTAFSGGSH